MVNLLLQHQPYRLNLLPALQYASVNAGRQVFRDKLYPKIAGLCPLPVGQYAYQPAKVVVQTDTDQTFLCQSGAQCKYSQ